jgi:hypothetical protein
MYFTWFALISRPVGQVHADNTWPVYSHQAQNCTSPTPSHIEHSFPSASTLFPLQSGQRDQNFSFALQLGQLKKPVSEHCSHSAIAVPRRLCRSSKDVALKLCRMKLYTFDLENELAEKLSDV